MSWTVCPLALCHRSDQTYLTVLLEPHVSSCRLTGQRNVMTARPCQRLRTSCLGTCATMKWCAVCHLLEAKRTTRSLSFCPWFSHRATLHGAAAAVSQHAGPIPLSFTGVPCCQFRCSSTATSPAISPRGRRGLTRPLPYTVQAASAEAAAWPPTPLATMARLPCTRRCAT